MKIHLAVCLTLVLVAAPALAEKLSFDHRRSPPLKAVLDAKAPGMIDYNDKNPRHVVDVIAVRGKSARDWTEALIITVRTADRKVRTAPEWMAQLREDAQRRCPSEFTTIAEDANSITLERRSLGCAAQYPPYAVYRAVTGSRSLFLLTIAVRDEIGEQSRREWLDLLASARIE